jgi:chromosomal replication initiation ATPase DnaA
VAGQSHHADRSAAFREVAVGSRLRQQPDDALFRAIIQLLFADRGMHIPDDVLKYIGDRVERSYWMAERVVEAIDRFAIAERSRLTLPTIRRALGEGGIVGARGAA